MDKPKEAESMSDPTQPHLIQKSHPRPNHCLQPSGGPAPEDKSCTHVPVLANHRSINGLTALQSVYQNLAPRFFCFLSCFNPLISILFANPVGVAYPVPVPIPVPVPVPMGKPLLPGIG